MKAKHRPRARQHRPNEKYEPRIDGCAVDSDAHPTSSGWLGSHLGTCLGILRIFETYYTSRRRRTWMYLSNRAFIGPLSISIRLRPRCQARLARPSRPVRPDSFPCPSQNLCWWDWGRCTGASALVESRRRWQKHWQIGDDEGHDCGASKSAIISCLMARNAGNIRDMPTEKYPGVLLFLLESSLSPNQLWMLKTTAPLATTIVSMRADD